MKKIVFIGLIALLVLLSGCIEQPSPPPTELPPDTVFSDNCEELEDQVRVLLEKANYCNTDSDCVASMEFGCPFGCYNFINANADLTEIKKGIGIYQEKLCEVCKYSCIAPPSNLVCENNKCVASAPEEKTLSDLEKFKTLCESTGGTFYDDCHRRKAEFCTWGIETEGKQIACDCEDTKFWDSEIGCKVF